MSAERAYRWLLGLLPPGVTEEERAEIAGSFAAWHRDAAAGGRRRRARVLAAAFGRLPGVIALEWRDHLSARRAARRQPGGGVMGALWSALRLGGRSLAKSPSFTWSAVLLLGLGIGAVTAIFSVVDHVAFRSLPYPAPDRVVVFENGSHSGPTFRRLQEMRTVESVAGIFVRDANLTGGDEPVRLRGSEITRLYFPLFGARPALGRLFVADDFDRSEGVVLSYHTWQTVLGADSTVIGREIRIDGTPRVVVGVAAADFVAPEALDVADFWRPVDWSSDYYTRDDYYVLSIAGRLAPGTTLAQAQAEADAVAQRRAEENPDRFARSDGTVDALPVTSLLDATVGDVRLGLGLFLGAVALLLLVACVNVAHLFMARGVERAREMSVRRALGAATGALARQLAVESLLVGAGGAAVGLALAFAGVGVFRASAPEGLPRLDTISVDLRVMAFALAVGLATSLAFGLLPALRLASRTRENPLHMAGRGSTPTRRTHAVRQGLVVVEVALSLVLAAQAGWLIRSFAELNSTELGFRTANIWTIPLRPTGLATGEEWNQLLRGVRESVLAVPGVEAATYGISMPLEAVGGSRCCWGSSADFDEAGGDEFRSWMHPVEAGYFDLFDLRIVAGRTWTAAEDPAAGAGDEAGNSGGPAPAVITEPLAVEAFGAAEEAPGHTFTLGGDNRFTVVGVTADNRHFGPDQEHGSAIYVPAGYMPFGSPIANVAVRVAGTPAGLPRALAEAVWRAEPDLPVPVVRSMDQWARQATARARYVSSLFATFGLVTLLLVAGGLAGTLLYTVRTRRRELGIRLALGAAPGNVEGDVLRRGTLLALAGVALGGVGAWMSGRLLEGFVSEIQARDATTFLITVAVLLGVALVSSWVPARRAAAIDPMETLRVE